MKTENAKKLLQEYKKKLSDELSDDTLVFWENSKLAQQQNKARKKIAEKIKLIESAIQELG